MCMRAPKMPPPPPPPAAPAPASPDSSPRFMAADNLRVGGSSDEDGSKGQLDAANRKGRRRLRIDMASNGGSGSEGAGLNIPQ
jgi:hypothetical protein